MVKTILKEAGIVILLLIAIALVLRVILNGYLPSDKTVPAKLEAYVFPEDVPADVVEKEKEIIRAQALNEGKPEAAVERIVTGRIDKYFAESCLLDQEFIKDPDKTVQQVLKKY